MYIETKVEFHSDENQKKTKSVYKKKTHHYINVYSGDEHSHTSYPSNKNTSSWNMFVCGKIYSDKREATQYEDHKPLEKEYGLKLRAKRSKRILAAPWEEVYSSFHEKKKCWKDNSKRKNQYYKEKDDKTI